MNKVLIIGCPGAGKSTFARKLHSIIGLPLYYLDMIWHKEDRTNILQEDFDNTLDEILDKDTWIIDGNYLRSMDRRLSKCDTVFFLDYPIGLCLQAIQERIGIKREDMPWIEEDLDEEFRLYVENFPNNQLGRIYELLEKHEDKKIVIFKNRNEADEYLKELMRK